MLSLPSSLAGIVAGGRQKKQAKAARWHCVQAAGRMGTQQCWVPRISWHQIFGWEWDVSDKQLLSKQTAFWPNEYWTCIKGQHGTELPLCPYNQIKSFFNIKVWWIMQERKPFWLQSIQAAQDTFRDHYTLQKLAIFMYFGITFPVHFSVILAVFQNYYYWFFFFFKPSSAYNDTVTLDMEKLIKSISEVRNISF